MYALSQGCSSDAAQLLLPGACRDEEVSQTAQYAGRGMAPPGSPGADGHLPGAGQIPGVQAVMLPGTCSLHGHVFPRVFPGVFPRVFPRVFPVPVPGLCWPPHVSQPTPCRRMHVVSARAAQEGPSNTSGWLLLTAAPLSWEHGLVAASSCPWGPWGDSMSLGTQGGCALGHRHGGLLKAVAAWVGVTQAGALSAFDLLGTGEKKAPPIQKHTDQPSKRKEAVAQRRRKAGVVRRRLARCQHGDAPEQTCQAVIADRLISRDETVIFNSC